MLKSAGTDVLCALEIGKKRSAERKKTTRGAGWSVGRNCHETGSEKAELVELQCKLDNIYKHKVEGAHRSVCVCGGSWVINTLSELNRVGSSGLCLK